MSAEITLLIVEAIMVDNDKRAGVGRRRGDEDEHLIPGDRRLS